MDKNARLAVAGPPSPESPGLPLPATVVMIPSGVTFRTRLADCSAMKRLPCESTAIARTVSKLAAVAGPPSPVVLVPPPATVRMVPSAVTFRTRPPFNSPMYRFPCWSTAIPIGVYNCATVARPPSPA